MSGEADPLVEAAGRVADGSAVDWKSLERELPAARGAIDGLRRLALLNAAAGTGGKGEGADPEEARSWRWGHLEVLERLGEGAFGEVWRAFDPVLSRDVALKLRRTDTLESPAEAGVFLEEARHLARVRHPNVLGVHGADVHGNRVGLWTDLLYGRTLQETVASYGPLEPGRVIEIGKALAGALAAVHRAGLVHGDVKGGNVMLETEGGRTVLMDFGAAAPAERAGRFGSPLSMAPELLAGERPTAKSDVYSLGVLLYHLSCGRYPVEADRVEDLVAGHRGAVAEARARRLSAPRGLRRLVTGLLARDPRDRPDSARTLELIRRLEDAPGRRRRLVGVAAVVTSLAVGTVLASVGYLRARQEARRAQAARDFVVGLFAGVDPDLARGRTVTAKELLDRGARRLDTELAGQPALRADMLGVVGRLYEKLGLYEQARPLLQEALDVRRRLEGPRDAGAAESAGDLASVLSQLGEFEAAEALAREAVAARRAAAGHDPAALAASLGTLGDVVSRRGRADEADALYREAVAIQRRLGDWTALAERLGGHGTALWRAARYDEARRAHEESLSILREAFGDEHTAVATSRLELGTDLMELGRLGDAEALFRECLAMRRKLLGDVHPHVATAYGNLSDVLQRAGRLDEAEQAAREALRLMKAALGDAHPDTANSLNHLGGVLYFRGRYREAAVTFEQVLPLWRETYGPHHSNVFTALNNLGAARREAGDYAAAERVLRETLALRREALGDAHPDVAQSLNNLASLLGRTGADAEAEAAFEQAITTWRASLGDGHPTLSYGLVELGKFLVDRGRHAEAEPLLKEGARIRAASLDGGAPLLASARLYLGECLLGLGRASQALPHLEAALPVLLERWGERNEVSRRARRALTRARAAARGAPP